MRDVSHWEVVQESRGSRQGYWLLEPHSDRRALVKVPRVFHIQGVPFECAETASEVLACEVGRFLGVPVPDVEAVWFQGRVCCLSWSFVPAGYEFREGTDITGSTREDRRVSLDEARHALTGYLGREVATTSLIRLACFDLLIGNSDRHQANWGILRRILPQQDPQWSMAPFYDNGSAFGSNLHPAKVRQYLVDGLEQFDKGFKYEISATGARRARINELLAKLLEWDSDLACLTDRLRELTDSVVWRLVDGLGEEVVTEERREFARRLLMRRRNLMLDEVNRHGR